MGSTMAAVGTQGNNDSGRGDDKLDMITSMVDI